MKALQCEMCGSQDLVKDGGVFVCQSCGTKYSVEEARKMMVEGTVDVKGTVKVDTSDELKNLYEIARRAKDDHNDENALKYYDMILVKDPKSWEANFFAIYYQTMTCKIAQIANAAFKLEHCLDSVCSLARDNINNLEERKKAINEIFVYSTTAATMLSKAASSHYNRIDEQIRGNYTQDYINNLSASKNICYNLGDSIIKYFGEEYGNLAAQAWRKAIIIHVKFVDLIQEKDSNLRIINEYSDKIRKYEPEYQNIYVEKKSACYVATAVYGSYDCPEVWTLRRYRDYTLDETWYGRLFIKAYYAISPTFVKYFGNVKVFRLQGKKLLDRWVSKLNSKGYERTPYKDKY